jgi:hypothetical protein
MSDLENRDEALIEALRRLPREMPPPDHVRSAVRAHVPEHYPPRARQNVARVLIAASLVIAAFAAGRATAPRPATAPAVGQKFALLLYGGASGGGDDRAAEYGAWALEQRRAGRQVAGERLADEAWTAGPSAGDPLPLRGFFIIRATDAGEALDLARRHPHARDGSVVVRRIDTP